MTQYKTCSKCLQTKPYEEFGNHKKTLDGKYSSCFVCTRVMRKAYRGRNKESIKKQLSDNYRRNRGKRLAYVAERYKQNPQPIKDAAKRWQKRNPEYFAAYQRQRTARKRNNDLRYVSKKELQSMYKKPCIYCGTKNNIEIDHIIPIARGGRHSIGNLTPACMSCNRSKRHLFVMEWRLKK